jgi:hypothetical protein
MLLSVAGAVVNVAVAWAIAVWTPFVKDPFVYLSPDDAKALLHARFDGIADVDPKRASGIISEQFGRTYFGATVNPDASPYLEVYEYGLPFRSLAGEYRGSFEKIYPVWFISMPLQIPGSSHSLPPFFPLRPAWPGFAINTVLYGAILWMLFAAPGMIRRRRRINRSLCPACAYPVGASDVCTECGKPVRVLVG